MATTIGALAAKSGGDVNDPVPGMEPQQRGCLLVLMGLFLLILWKLILSLCPNIYP